MTENTPRAFSIDEAVSALRQSREDQAKAAGQQEEAEADPEEVQEDQAEDEADGESEPESDAEPEDEPEGEDEGSDDDLYEVGGEQFTLAELREWKASGLRNADYTRKTQELAEARKGFETERQQWDADREAAIDHFKQQQAQLTAALATFAVDQDPEPSPDGLTWEEFTRRKGAWDKRQAKKAQAREAFQALQAQQHQEILQRETAQLMRHFPAWKDPAVFETEARALASVAGQYGFTPAEMSAITDHRMLRVLNDLRVLSAEAEGRKASKAEAAKKVAVAARKLAPGAKIDGKNQPTRELRQKQDQLRKTGSMQDAVAVLKARRMAR